MARFKYSGRQAFSDAFSAQAARFTKSSNVSCWYIIQPMGVKLFLKQKSLRRRLAFTPTSIATFNPVIYHLELTLQPLTGNHAAHCYFGNIQNGYRTSTMNDDFNPITAFNLPNKGLKIIQLNIRSITNKLAQIRLMLHNETVDILAITETWLDNFWTDNELVVTGYNPLRRDRKTAHGGGIIIYIHNSLSAERRSDLESELIEQISIEFKQFKCAPILLSCFYRAPDSTVSFFDGLANIVDSIVAENKEVHIVGDFNVDLIKKSRSESKQILHLMENQGLQQMVITPTRITENSSTLIDHHYCSHPENVLSITSPSFGLSDHNPTILVRKQNANLKSTKKAHFTVTYRPLKKLNADSLIKDLNEVPWTVLDTFDNDPDEMLATWEALVLDVVDRHAPLKSVRVKSMKKPSWLSDQILRAIKERDRLKKELEKGRIQKVSFNAARNKVVRLIEKAKKEAVINEIDNSKFNSRILWKTLESIFPTSVRQLSRINSVTKDGTSYTTPEEISNVFNEHFISIADNIIDKTINTKPDHCVQSAK
ncbi:uncharacterized protein [Montipora foliosa]|uniref:uncharacterized protein n=1 Tax=Montipora foliosa TaxID=591990 RepID=UPI0035F14164